MRKLVEIFHRNFEVILAYSPELIEEAYRLRYQVYCVENKFEDSHCFTDDKEHDEYDMRSVHALVRHKPSGHYAGVVRMILPDDQDCERPFPLEQHSKRVGEATQKGSSQDIPRQSLAEISRFCVSKEFKQRIAESLSVSGVSNKPFYGDSVHEDKYHRRIMPHIILGLFAGIIKISVEHNISHWLAVMEPSLLRLLGRCGIYFEPIGPLMDYHGLRQPAFGAAEKIVQGIYKQRPDIWEIITENGRFFPLDKPQEQNEKRMANGE